MNGAISDRDLAGRIVSAGVTSNHESAISAVYDALWDSGYTETARAFGEVVTDLLSLKDECAYCGESDQNCLGYLDFGPTICRRCMRMHLESCLEEDE